MGVPLPRRLILLDGLAALGFALLPQVAALQPADRAAHDHRVWLLLALAALPLTVRRIWPVPVFLLVFMLSCAAALFGLGPVSFLAAGYALYPVALAQPPRRWYSAAVVGGVSTACAIGLTMTGTSHRGGAWAGQVMLGLVVLMAAWAAGRAVSERRDRTRRAIEDTVQHVKIDERLRIAREMHDVVTHSMGLIAVKAGVANHVAREQPEEALDALTVIENVSRNALREMSVLLGVLRSDKDAGGDLRPLPRLSDLSEVVKVAEAAGVQVELTAPPGDTLPDGVALSTFRIVQEALTNVVKHAAPTRCRVSIVTGPGSVSIKVEDDGCESTAHPHRGDGGFGLLGMRERAAAHAGTVTAEPRPGRGFAVSAVLYY